MFSRNLKLDVLRGLAILLVLGRHLPEGSTPASGILIDIGRFWYRIGWSGVDLFFVLSGFLVSRIVYTEFQKNGPIDLSRFFMRRGLRIWPAYYVMTFATLIFVFRHNALTQILSEIFFLQSYVGHIWDHTWTLAVEEHFYLFFGVLAWTLSRSKSRDPFKNIRWIWAIAALGCLILRFLIPYGDMWPFARTHLRVDALLFGALLSYYDCFHQTMTAAWVRKWRLLLMLLACVLLSPLFFLHLGVEPFLPRFGLTFAYMGYGILVLLANYADKKHGNRMQNGLAWIGVRSYSIYLWHLPVLFFLAQPIARNMGGLEGLWMALLVYLAGSVAAGWASYTWIEQPCLRWREKRFSPAS